MNERLSVIDQRAIAEHLNDLRNPPHVTIQLRGPDGDVANVPWEAALVRVLGEINGALQRIALRMEAHDAAST